MSKPTEDDALVSDKKKDSQSGATSKHVIPRENDDEITRVEEEAAVVELDVQQPVLVALPPQPMPNNHTLYPSIKFFSIEQVTLSGASNGSENGVTDQATKHRVTLDAFFADIPLQQTQEPVSQPGSFAHARLLSHENSVDEYMTNLPGMGASPISTVC